MNIFGIQMFIKPNSTTGDIWSHPVIVAHTEESLILRHDFLMQNKGVINTAERKILFDGKPVECSLQNKLSSLFKVRVSESVVIPANSEVIVPGYIGREDNEVLPRLAIVESTEGTGSKGLLLVRSVVAPSSQVIPLCILNLDENAKKLYKSTVVGTCDPTLEVFDNVSSDHETSAARRGKVDSSDLSDHLKVILENCGKSLDTYQQAAVESSVRMYSDIFAVNKTDRGRTDLVQHQINTGNHPFFNQRPRHLPISQSEVEKEKSEKMLSSGVIEPSERRRKKDDYC